MIPRKVSKKALGLTIQDLSCALPSANVNTRVNIHGSITVTNNLGYHVNGGMVGRTPGYNNAAGLDFSQEKFQVLIQSVFNNRAIILTQVSGEPLTETLPASFATELKLGGRAEYVGRV